MKRWHFRPGIFLLLFVFLSTTAQTCSDSNAVIPPDASDPVFDYYECIDTAASDSPKGTSNVATVGDSDLFPDSKKLWGLANPSDPANPFPRKIPICWDATAMKSEYDEYRALVRDAAEQTWGRALDITGITDAERIGFVGWQPCTSAPYEVKLVVRDVGPYAQALGTAGAGRMVVLNFEFGTWSQGCASDEANKRRCMYDIAVHEFGHILGIAHEHNRPDTDRETCTDAPQGGYGDLMIGEWDPKSVMNYCSPRWNNDGKLTQTDVWGIQRAYYPKYFSASCDLPVTSTAR